MRRIHLIVLASWVVIAPVLAGCADFDPDKWDVFGWNEKKKLPGDRRAVFPEGVPGVSQGIPKEYIKGNEPPADAAATIPVEQEPAAAKPSKKTAAVEPGEKPKAKTAKRKAKPAATAAAPAQGGDPQQATAPWPTQGQGQPQGQTQGQTSNTAPWPASPAPGTFSR